MNDQSEKQGPLKRGKSALLSLLSMIERSKDRDIKTWTRIFDAVAEFRFAEDPEITENENTVLEVILHSLFPKIPIRRRREFADFLSRRDEAPSMLVESLITDELTVAAPILARSAFVSDELFEKAIASGSRHRKIIAGRTELSQATINALLDADDIQSIDVLLDNNNVILNERTFLGLLRSYLGVPEREEKILSGRHLNLPLAYQSYWHWSALARGILLRRFPLTPDAFGDVLTSLVRLRGEGNEATNALSDAVELQERIEGIRRNGFTLILDQSDIDGLVEFMVNGLAVGSRTVKRILTDASGTSLAVFCLAVGLSRAQFEEIYCQLFQTEIDWQAYANNLSRSVLIYETMSATSAASIVAIWSFGDTRPNGTKSSEIAA